MANVTITVGAFTQTRTLTAPQVTRALAAYKVHMNNPDATNQEIANFIIDGFFSQLRSVVKQSELREAQEAVPDPDFEYGS
jgi:hypothetical protein